MIRDTGTGGETRVTYGEWERDPDVIPVIVQLRGFNNRPLGPRLQHAFRRRVYTNWRDENGVRWGRWEWERAV